jgi:hypothetical protein
MKQTSCARFSVFSASFIRLNSIRSGRDDFFLCQPSRVFQRLRDQDPGVFCLIVREEEPTPAVVLWRLGRVNGKGTSTTSPCLKFVVDGILGVVPELECRLGRLEPGDIARLNFQMRRQIVKQPDLIAHIQVLDRFADLPNRAHVNNRSRNPFQWKGASLACVGMKAFRKNRRKKEEMEREGRVT